MKKLYLPCLFSKSTVVELGASTKILIPEMDGFFSKEEAIMAAQKLALTDPKAKVVIFEATMVIEPRRIEFAEKTFTSDGELLA